jgi:putative redox protein
MVEVGAVTVTARRREGYVHDVEIEGGHSMVIDEPKEAGGRNEGPSPTRALAAALAACTAITVEMYAARKEWRLEDVEAEVEMEYEGFVPSRFNVTLRLPKELSEDQTNRLKAIAGRCPVHRALKHETEVTVVDRVELV